MSYACTVSHVDIHTGVSLYIHYFTAHYIPHTVPAPTVQFSPSNRTTYYSGENLNVTCNSNVKSEVFIWSTFSEPGSLKPLSIPSTIISISNHTSVIAYKSLNSKYSTYFVLCNVSTSDNVNIIPGTNSAIFYVQGKTA